MPRGGRREGAGRPPTYRRVQMDEEAARQFAELLAAAQAESPEAHWTPSALLSYLITEQWMRKQREQRGV